MTFLKKPPKTERWVNFRRALRSIVHNAGMTSFTPTGPGALPVGQIHGAARGKPALEPVDAAPPRHPTQPSGQTGLGHVESPC